MVNGVPTDPGGKSLVEPELTVLVSKYSDVFCVTYLVPPVHSNQIAKPLVSKFVGNYVNNAVLVFLIRGVFIEEYSGSSGRRSGVILTTLLSIHTCK